MRMLYCVSEVEILLYHRVRICPYAMIVHVAAVVCDFLIHVLCTCRSVAFHPHP